MKRALWTLALVASGCAHGGVSTTGSAKLAGQPHAPLGLDVLQGLDEQQAPVLEGSLCQAMVEANHGDVACPSAQRAAVDVARTGVMMNGGSDAAAVPERLAHHVLASVSPSGTEWVLKLDYFDTADGQPKASAQLTAASFDELVQKSPDAVKALLQ